MRRVLTPIAACSMAWLPCAAMAHAGHAHASALRSWTFDWLTVTLVLLSTAAYMAGLLRMQAAGRSAILRPWRVAAFFAGSMMLVLALMSPLDRLAESYFSAHMTQHLLLMLAAPPMLVAAHPLIAWLWCLPRQARQSVGRWWAGKAPVRRIIGLLLHPASVWIGATLALWFWHMPRPYAWALSNDTVHAVEHASFFLTSLAFWYVLLEQRGRTYFGYGGAVLFGLTFGIQNGFLGAILTFAPRPLYAAYQLNTHAGMFGLTSLEDQQLAGILMWVPNGIVHLGLLLILLRNWLEAENRQSPAVSPASRQRPNCRTRAATTH